MPKSKQLKKALAVVTYRYDSERNEVLFDVSGYSLRELREDARRQGQEMLGTNRRFSVSILNNAG